MDSSREREFNKKYSLSQTSPAWQDAAAEVVRFWCDDGSCWGFIFHHLGSSFYDRDTLLLEWSVGTIKIRGPKALAFYDKFSEHKATGIKADGVDIVSVTMRLKVDDLVEQTVNELTDDDLRID
jgi:hypothetical protein